MGTPPTPQPEQPAGTREHALLLVANDMEQAFNALDGRTLSDDETATVYTLTLTLVENALAGAEANGIITAGQHRELAVLIGGMKEAPEHL